MGSWTAAALAVSLAACSAADPRADTVDEKESASPATQGADAQSVIGHLQTILDLSSGDPVSQTEAFRTVAQTAAIEPTATNRLRLALALGTPGHPFSNAADAQRLFSELLAARHALSPAERLLASIGLEETERQSLRDAEVRELQRAADERGAATESRLRAAQEENQRLARELNDAREKLNAITDIERSIGKRSADGRERE